MAVCRRPPARLAAAAHASCATNVGLLETVGRKARVSRLVCETGRLAFGSGSDRRGKPSAEQSSQRGLVGAARRWFVAVRSFVHRWPGGRHAWRAWIGVLGLVVVIAGIVMLVLPGPGWVVIFVGFGIWATEFPWAHSMLLSVRRRVASWTSWIRNRLS